MKGLLEVKVGLHRSACLRILHGRSFPLHPVPLEVDPMTEKEKQMYCCILEISAEEVEGLELIAERGGYSGISHMIRHSVVLQVYALASFEPCYTNRALHTVLKEFVKARANFN
jgi:hypothetical protein